MNTWGWNRVNGTVELWGEGLDVRSWQTKTKKKVFSGKILCKIVDRASRGCKEY